MLQAHCQKVLDFSQADPTSRHWNQKLNWAISWLDRQNNMTVLSARQAHYLAAAMTTGPDKFESLWRSSLDTLQEIEYCVNPWDKKNKKARGDMAKELTEQWDAAFGNHDDPATKARIARTVAALSLT